MKLCIVCGNTEKDDVTECSNCSNNDLRLITSASYGGDKFSGEYELSEEEKQIFIKIRKRKLEKPYTYDFYREFINRGN